MNTVFILYSLCSLRYWDVKGCLGRNITNSIDILTSLNTKIIVCFSYPINLSMYWKALKFRASSQPFQQKRVTGSLKPHLWWRTALKKGVEDEDSSLCRGLLSNLIKYKNEPDRKDIVASRRWKAWSECDGRRWGSAGIPSVRVLNPKLLAKKPPALSVCA